MASSLTIDTLRMNETWETGAFRITLLPARRVHWVAPWPGSEAAMSEALEATLGAPFPQPGAASEVQEGTLAWSGRSAAFLFDAEPPKEIAAHGAVIDVSDGWVGFVLSGASTADVMARVCPVDLRTSLFPVPRALRTEVAHVTALVLTGRSELELWVMRSFAVSVVEELQHAARAVAARVVASE